MGGVATQNRADERKKDLQLKNFESKSIQSRVYTSELGWLGRSISKPSGDNKTRNPYPMPMSD